MKYAIHISNFGPFGDARAVADLARDAENAGWDGFFIWDHVARSPAVGDVVDPWIALTVAAMTTERVRLGTMVTPLPRRRPWKVARETASLDQLCGGRLILGVGIGSGREYEWADLGEEVDPRVRARMLDEGLDVLVGLWRGEPFNYDGQHYAIKDACFLPTPAQSPRIPVWVGGDWPNKPPFRRAARWDGVFPMLRGNAAPLDQFKALMAYVHAQRESIGREGSFDAAIQPEPLPGDDPVRAAEIVAPYTAAGATWWLEDLAPRRFGLDVHDSRLPEMVRERVLQGPPAS